MVYLLQFHKVLLYHANATYQLPEMKINFANSYRAPSILELMSNETDPANVTKLSEGIYNMGRNVGFKILFPIGGHKVSDTEMKDVD